MVDLNAKRVLELWEDPRPIPVPRTRAQLPPRGAAAAAHRPEAAGHRPARGARASRSTAGRSPGRAGASASASPRARGWCCTTSSIRDGAAQRRIIHRASITEMVVPYADPTTNHCWKNAFDAGRVRPRQAGELAGAGLRLPRRDPLLRRPGGGRRRQALRHAERHLHARGGLRHPLEALRIPHRRARGAAVAAAGDQLLRHGRQLRLRLLLVPLPGRHHPARGEAHRHHPDRRRHARGGVSLGRHGAARPRRPDAPAPVLRAAAHGGGRAGEQRDGARVRPAPLGPRQPAWQRLRHHLADFVARAGCGARGRWPHRPLLEDRQPEPAQRGRQCAGLQAGGAARAR